MVKLLVLYVFHQYNDRVRHFLRNSIFYDKNVDFIIICNDKSLNIDDEIFHYNVSVLYRDNIGFDFGGWSDGLLTDDLYKNYTHFIFINSSVYGPYLHPDYKGRWTDKYLENLKGDIKLFGCTINANMWCSRKNQDLRLSVAHVQSYVFTMDMNTLCYLIEHGIFSNTTYSTELGGSVWQKEIKMSRLILEKGWNFGSMLKMYDGVDFRFRDKTVFDYDQEFYKDVMYKQHENILWDRTDVVFVKGNRDLDK